MFPDVGVSKTALKVFLGIVLMPGGALAVAC
jgi:hypothetical protein